MFLTTTAPTTESPLIRKLQEKKTTDSINDAEGIRCDPTDIITNCFYMLAFYREGNATVSWRGATSAQGAETCHTIHCKSGGTAFGGARFFLSSSSLFAVVKDPKRLSKIEAQEEHKTTTNKHSHVARTAASAGCQSIGPHESPSVSSIPIPSCRYPLLLQCTRFELLVALTVIVVPRIPLS